RVAKPIAAARAELGAEAGRMQLPQLLQSWRPRRPIDDRLVGGLDMILQTERRRSDRERGNRTIGSRSQQHSTLRQRLHLGAMPLHAALRFAEARVKQVLAPGVAQRNIEQVDLAD